MLEQRRMLVSVTNKTDLHKLKTLADAGWGVMSTGGTATALDQAGVRCVGIENVSGFPEMMEVD